MEHSKEYNRRLCEKYPFLIPSNRWSGKRITEGAGFWPESPDSVPEWDYENTELDDMPEGWRIAFGEQLCAELKAELEKDGFLDKYRIVQIKEKFGELRWYDNYGTVAMTRIIDKYSVMSARICLCCGKPATRITQGWIAPFCDECCPDKYYIPIEEFFREDDDDDASPR